MGMKCIITSISAPFGVLSDTLTNFRLSNDVWLFFELQNENTIKIKYVFDKSELNRNEAISFAQRYTKAIALDLALKNSINFEWDYSIQDTWIEDEKGISSSSVNVHISGAARIIVRKNLILNPEHINFKILDAMEFFNNSLKNKENSFDEREIALWLYLSWESLKTVLNSKDNELIDKLEKDFGISRQLLKDFKYSIGKYYRHLNADKPGTLIPIDQCINTMRNILNQIKEAEQKLR